MNHSIKTVSEGKYSIVTGFYYAPSGTHVTYQIQRDWNVRFTYVPTGSTYTGEVLNGYRNGKGIYKTIEGISYEGEWKNGLKHGKGKMINNEIIYDEIGIMVICMELGKLYRKIILIMLVIVIIFIMEVLSLIKL